MVRNPTFPDAFTMAVLLYLKNVVATTTARSNPRTDVATLAMPGASSKPETLKTNKNFKIYFCCILLNCKS